MDRTNATNIEGDFMSVLVRIIPPVGSLVLLLTLLNIILTVQQGMSARPILKLYLNHLFIDLLGIASNCALLAHVYAETPPQWFDNLMLASFYSSITVFAGVSMVRLFIFMRGLPVHPQRIIHVAIACSWLVTISFLVVRFIFKVPNYDTHPALSSAHSSIVILIGLGTLAINLFILVKLKLHEREMNRHNGDGASATDDSTVNHSSSSRESPNEPTVEEVPPPEPINLQQRAANKTALMLFVNNFVSSLYFLCLNLYLLGLYSSGGSCKAPRNTSSVEYCVFFFVCTISGSHKLQLLFLLVQSLGNNLIILLQSRSKEVIYGWVYSARVILGLVDETTVSR